ncbi:hypothetical protein L6452_09031 [Arctium lappa]|uniref:Uncharacterized protein n=1 Tax=Arctium lappa TaxID=4217 RepID=A0ACB9DJ86_ARCLA|nr:hypothetical protein L6452_09031 [Arctium lappa]
MGRGTSLSPMGKSYDSTYVVTPRCRKVQWFFPKQKRSYNEEVTAKTVNEKKTRGGRRLMPRPKVARPIKRQLTWDDACKEVVGTPGYDVVRCHAINVVWVVYFCVSSALNGYGYQ